jgi:stage IV sporulation protein FB
LGTCRAVCRNYETIGSPDQNRETAGDVGSSPGMIGFDFPTPIAERLTPNLHRRTPKPARPIAVLSFVEYSPLDSLALWECFAMFGAEGTPFDLRMHLVRIPVRVIPTFWLVAALLGWDPERFDLVAIWMLCMFVSILVHELGHALTAEAFGYETEITLYHFGGFARFNPGYDFPPIRSFLITLAGPFAGFALAGLTFAVMVGLELAEVPENEYARAAVGNLLYINIVWGLFNLLPLLPMDGGKLMEATFGLFGVRRALDWALKISVVTGALCALAAFQFGMQTMGIWLALMTVENVQHIQAQRW